MDKKTEDSLVRGINKWTDARIKNTGHCAVRSIDNQLLDWGQAACYMYYGAGWNDEDMSIIPPDVLEILAEWDDDNMPEWVDYLVYPTDEIK